MKTFSLLRERLAGGDDQVIFSETTIAAIMGIAGHAFLMRDLKSARHHVDGLCKIVNLRGGVASFERNPKLLIEILRYDSSLAGSQQPNKVLIVTGAI